MLYDISMQAWQAVLLGIIEGITEFLPVSSTGHLILTSYLLHIPRSNFLSTFEIAIQSGAILAVICVYWRKVISSKQLIQKLIVSFLPAAALGFFFYRPIKQYLLGNELITVLALIIGGVFFLGIELSLKKKIRQQNAHQLTTLQAFLVGVGQSVAIIPGVSRSAATMFTGMLVGLSRKEAVEYSFLLAIPTIVAASGYDLLKTSPTFSGEEYLLLGLGTISAFLSAYAAVTWFIRYISQHTFIPFAIYRISIGIIFALLFLRDTSL